MLFKEIPECVFVLLVFFRGFFPLILNDDLAIWRWRTVEAKRCRGKFIDVFYEFLQDWNCLKMVHRLPFCTAAINKDVVVLGLVAVRDNVFVRVQLLVPHTRNNVPAISVFELLLLRKRHIFQMRDHELAILACPLQMRLFKYALHGERLFQCCRHFRFYFSHYNTDLIRKNLPALLKMMHDLNKLLFCFLVIVLVTGKYPIECFDSTPVFGNTQLSSYVSDITVL